RCGRARERLAPPGLPQWRVYNKIDLIDMEPRIDRGDDGAPVAVWLSAQTGAGCDLLFQAIAELLGEEMVLGRLLLAADQGRLRAMLYQQQAVADESYRDDGSSELELRIRKSDLLRILSAESLPLDKLTWVAEGNRP